MLLFDQTEDDWRGHVTHVPRPGCQAPEHGQRRGLPALRHRRGEQQTRAGLPGIKCMGEEHPKRDDLGRVIGKGKVTAKSLADFVKQLDRADWNRFRGALDRVLAGKADNFCGIHHEPPPTL